MSMDLALSNIARKESVITKLSEDGAGKLLFNDNLVVNDWNDILNKPEDRIRKTTFSTNDPSGGSNGDMWIKYYE